jgi:hypothetical protein
LNSYSTDDDGDVLLTAECASMAEFEANVAMLRSDLDKIVVEARKRFAKADAAGPQDIFARSN